MSRLSLLGLLVLGSGAALAGTTWRQQAFIHNMTCGADGVCTAEFNLGRSCCGEDAPLKLEWQGLPDVVYEAVVNGALTQRVSGTVCSVRLERGQFRRAHNSLSLMTVQGVDATLCATNRIALFATVPAEEGPRLDERVFFLEKLNREIPAFAAAAAAYERGETTAACRLFADHVRATYRVEQEVTDYFNRPREKTERDKSIFLGRAALDFRFEECGVWYTFPARRVAWQFNPTWNGYDEWCYHFANFNFSERLVDYYALSHDPAVPPVWCELVAGFIRDELLPPDSTSPFDTISWRSLDTAGRLTHLLRALPFVLPDAACTDDFLVLLARSLYEHAHRLRTRHAGAGNWLTNEMTSLFRFTYLAPWFRETTAWRAYAHEKVMREVAGQVYPDGQQHELAPGYHCAVARMFLRVPAVYRFAGLEPPHEVMATVGRMFDPFMKLMRPDRRMPGLNDAVDAPVAKFMQYGLKSFPERKDFVWFASAGCDGEPPDWTSASLPYMGAVALRSGWGTDALWAYMDCGPFGAGHQHEDKLNVLLSAYGHNLITEAGWYDYDTSKMRQYVLSTRGHNTVRFDGRDQDRRSTYRWRPEMIAQKADFSFSCGDRFDQAEATYDEGYQGIPRGKGLRHTRRLVFVKRPERTAPFFVVDDRFAASDVSEHTFEQIWHLNDGTMDSPAGTRFEAVYPGGVRLRAVASDATARFVDKRGTKEPELQGWQPGNWNLRNGHPIATPVLCGSFTGGRRVVTILQPLKTGMRNAVMAVVASSDSGADDVIVSLEDGTSLRVK